MINASRSILSSSLSSVINWLDVLKNIHSIVEVSNRNENDSQLNVLSVITKA